MFSLLSITYGTGSRMRFVPAATATREIPALRVWTAWFRATRLEEQAVSIVIEGPFQSKK
jgi:hypothetical protein